MVFCEVEKPWNSGKSAKFTKARKILRNSVESLSNTCLYNIFETYLSKFVLKLRHWKRANIVLRLPGVDYVVKSWALVMMWKALPLVHFWSVLLLREQMMTSVRKTFKTLLWSAQNRSISSEFSLKISIKSAVFTDCVSWSLLRKFSRNWPIFPRICP